MYYLRDAHDYEVDILTKKAGEVWSEMVYGHMKFDHEKTANALCGAILKQPGWFLRVIAHRHSEEVVGALLGICEEALCSKDKMATDVTIMVDATHRGHCTRQVIELLQEFRDWGIREDAKIIKIGVSSGINMDKFSLFMEKLGFARVGAIHAMVVGA